MDIDTHKEYIKEFCDHFDKSIKRLVDDAVKKNDELMTDRIYADILQVYFRMTFSILVYPSERKFHWNLNFVISLIENLLNLKFGLFLWF